MRAVLPLLNRGIGLPPDGACCELGFGQGISANLNAAGSGSAWWGTDFNPRQAAFARRLAKSADVNGKFFDQSFAEFCNRSDLPDFSFICLHGIWSWISQENREVIIDFIRRKLVVGGLLYVSYNTQPGWAAFGPLRDLMAQFGESMVPASVGSVQRVEQSLGFIEKLFGVNPLYAIGNPAMADRLKGLKTLDRSYLAHEYFNRDWNPMPFNAMAEAMAAAKLDYACSATYSDHIDALNMSSDQKAFLDGIADERLRETSRDFIVNQQFRRDYWIKGATPIDANAKMNEAILQIAPVGVPEIPYLTSPVSGGGIVVSRLFQLFILGARKGYKSVDELINFIRVEYPALKLNKATPGSEGAGSDEQSKNILHAEVVSFLSEAQPILRHLGIY